MVLHVQNRINVSWANHNAAWKILLLLYQMFGSASPMGLHKMKTLFMETTEIPPEKTIAEIEAVLIQYGANAVLKEYAAGAIEAVSFRIKVGPSDIPFRLPCRWQAIQEIFVKRKAGKWNYIVSKATRDGLADKARRVAWRQILRWVQAQLALVETEMVTVQEVFFPYIQTKGGKTLYELQAGNLALLPEKTGG